MPINKNLWSTSFVCVTGGGGNTTHASLFISLRFDHAGNYLPLRGCLQSLVRYVIPLVILPTNTAYRISIPSNGNE